MATATIAYYTTDTDLDEDQAVDLEIDVLGLTDAMIASPAGLQLHRRDVAAGWQAFRAKYKLKGVVSTGYAVKELDCSDAELDFLRAKVRAHFELELQRVNGFVDGISGIVHERFVPCISMGDVDALTGIPHPRDCE